MGGSFKKMIVIFRKSSIAVTQSSLNTSFTHSNKRRTAEEDWEEEEFFMYDKRE